MQTSWLLAVAMVISACHHNGSSFGEACETSSDCARGLLCTQVGEHVHTCTRSCAMDAVVFDNYFHYTTDTTANPLTYIDSCRLEYGAGAACHIEGYCYLDPDKLDPCHSRCSSNMRCVGHTCVRK